MNWLARLFRPSPPAPRTRALDAAGGGRRWASDPGTGSFAADLAAGGPTIRRRAAHYHRNTAWGARASTALISNLIGGGIRPQSESPDATVRAAIDAAWAQWVEVADVAGRQSFYGLQALAARCVIESGESFSLLRISEAGVLQVQLIDVRQVDETLYREIGQTQRIIAGIEVDDTGRPAAFHVHAGVPGDPWWRATEPHRIEAERIVHVFEQLQPGQVRGLPWLAPVLLLLAELDQFEDAVLVRQKVAAMFCGFLTEIDTPAVSVFSGGKQTAETLTSTLEPGMMKTLPPGVDIKFSDPAQTDGNYLPFVQQQLRAIAAGVGLTYEMLSGDMTGVNYSSARAALIEFRRRVEQLQQQLIVRQFCRPIWQRWLELEVLAGRLPAGALGAPVRWVPPSWEWIDPLKDGQAEQLAIRTGIKSRSEVIRERGRDPDAVLAEIAAEREAAAAAGVTFETGEAPEAGGQQNAE